MIYKLHATATVGIPGGFIAEVSGVGYQILCAKKTADYFLARKTAEVWVFTHMKDGAVFLYGFCSQQEREFFGELTMISGVGPKVAVSILDTLSIGEILAAAASENHLVFKTVSGVGEKTAKKITLEIKHKLKKLQLFFHTETDSQTNKERIAEATSALLNMGFTEKNVRNVFSTLTFTDKKETAEIVRQALAVLASKSSQSHSFL